MDFSMPAPVLGFLASWAALAGGIWCLFERAEAVAAPDLKRRISLWLRGSSGPEGRESEWPAAFTELFDRVFGRRHLSVRCFARSSVASLCSVLILAVIWMTLYPWQAADYFSEGYWYSDFPLMVALIALVNLIPDYLSLLETRYVLQLISRPRRSILATVGLLGLDLVATAILTTGTIVFAAFLAGELNTLLDPLTLRHEIFRLESLDPQESMPLGVWFWAGFTTSVWLWLYLFSGILIRAAMSARSFLSRIARLLDIDDKPVRSLGFVALIIVSVLYCSVPLARALAGQRDVAPLALPEVGSVFTYRLTNEKSEAAEFVVSVLKEDAYDGRRALVIVNSLGHYTFVDQMTGDALAVAREDGTIVREYLPGGGRRFPLWIGKRRTRSVDYLKEPSSDELTRGTEVSVVETIEYVSVPAGTFRTFRIHTHYLEDSKRVDETTTWYAPNLGTYAKLTYRKTGAETTFELVRRDSQGLPGASAPSK